MKQYDALTCRADRNALDIVIAVSQLLPVTGVVDNDDSVTLYFDEGGLTPELEQSVASWLPEGALFERTHVEEQNWNAEFERSLAPVRLTDHLIITQSWNPVQPASADDLVITIDPKMSFGTGHHESTRLIARLMTRLGFQDRRVLDIGTGTGVLAILAAMRGAETVTAVDNNEWAVDNAAENVVHNNVTGIEIVHGELADTPARHYDIILANIHRNIIIELMPAMMARLQTAPHARVLTSGVLVADYESLLEEAGRHRLIPLDEERENEWIATTFGRRGDSEERA